MSATCLNCGYESKRDTALDPHWDRGRCTKRQPELAGELVEKNGVLRPVKERRS